MYHVPLAVQYIYMDGVMKEVKMEMGRRGVRFLRMVEGRDCLASCMQNDLVLCGESKEDLRVMVGEFAEVCRRRGLKVNAAKSKVMVLNGEEGLEYEVHVDGILSEHVSELKYLGRVLNEAGIDGAKCSRMVVSGTKVAGAIRSLFNAKD